VLFNELGHLSGGALTSFFIGLGIILVRGQRGGVTLPATTAVVTMHTGPTGPPYPWQRELLAARPCPLCFPFLRRSASISWPPATRARGPRPASS
jgi:hypothetical protein